ncbi:MAG: hypothetical protein JWN79_1710 [Gemmatimonadetes bacterium]|nr:hypothetical protein [Gemmatimonadota bacterium]
MRPVHRVRTLPVVLLLLGALTAARSLPARVANGIIVVRVVEEGTLRPVPNADVLERDGEVHRLTDGRGEVRFSVPSAGALRLRVRQLGFQPVERSIIGGPETFAGPVVIPLSRVVVLATTSARTSNACIGTADSLPSALSLLALEQLRFGAEQYARFWDAYPFRLSFERRTAYFSVDGKPLTVLVAKDSTSRRDWNTPYRPGAVVQGHGGTVSALALSVGALADSVFWENHCLVARRVVERDGRRMLPLEFLPSLSLATPDYGGTAWVDSATSELQRVDFQLMGLDRSVGLRRMEGYMTFAYPSPYIARPDSMVSLWWTRDPADGQSWGTPARVELLRVAAVKYLRDEPR